MITLAVLVGIVLTAVGFLGRLSPGVVTGISLLSWSQAVGLACLLWAIWARRAAVAARYRASDSGRYAVWALVVVLLLIGVSLVGSVKGEIQDGRLYDTVSKDLEKDDAVAALALSRHLQREAIQSERYAPLRLLLVERIAEHGNSDPHVTSAIREHLRTDADPAVRKAAEAALGKLMTDADIVKVIAELPQLAGETRRLFVGALRLRTEKDLEDPAAWRDWLERALPGLAAKGGFPLALAAYRAFPGDGSLRLASLGELRRRAAPEGDLRALLEDEDPKLREVAAHQLRKVGKPEVARVLADALKVETDAAAASTLAGAVLALDGKRGPDLLLDVVKTGRGEAGKQAAARRLTAGTGEATDDPVELLVRRHRQLESGPAKRGVLRQLIQEAPKSETARAELLRVARDRTDLALSRTSALRAVLAADGALLSNDELVELLDGKPHQGFAQAVRAELRRRTGKDGGRDPEKWRELLGE